MVIKQFLMTYNSTCWLMHVSDIMGEGASCSGLCFTQKSKIDQSLKTKRLRNVHP